MKMRCHLWPPQWEDGEEASLFTKAAMCPECISRPGLSGFLFWGVHRCERWHGRREGLILARELLSFLGCSHNMSADHPGWSCIVSPLYLAGILVCWPGGCTKPHCLRVRVCWVWFCRFWISGPNDSANSLGGDCASCLELCSGSGHTKVCLASSKGEGGRLCFIVLLLLSWTWTGVEDGSRPGK